jgi:predicted DNA-binding transcriptional regulator YafY
MLNLKIKLDTGRVSMARGNNQKLKLIYLMKILMENTDEHHPLTRQELIEELDKYGISAERKSIYDDIEALRLYGVDIIGTKSGKSYYYYVGNREFEIAELKLLVDVVQASRFITAKKSKELISKIEKLSNQFDAKKLQRQVVVSGRIKTMNESIYYNVDKIHTAIMEHRKISFQYYKWNVYKERELRHGGERYLISPWALTWDNENYYMLGYDHKAGKIKHYRVDKMLEIELSNEEREGRKLFQQLDMAVYTKKRFGMYDGEEQMISLLCKNSFADVMIDRFGCDVMMRKKDEEYFVLNTHVVVSRQFFGWIISLGDNVKIIGPEKVVQQMQTEIKELVNRYFV